MALDLGYSPVGLMLTEHCGNRAMRPVGPVAGRLTCDTTLRFPLPVPLPDVVSIQTRQPKLEGAREIPLRRLVKGALRVRPSRIGGK